MNQKKTKVLVWYIGEIEGIKVGHTYEHGGYEISFSYVGAPATVSPPFTDFDIIILPFGVFISDDGSIQYPDEYTKRKLELIKFIKSKNKITCFLFPLRETFVKLSHMKTRFNNPFPYLVPSDLSAYALSEYKSQFFLSEDVRNNESKYKIARSEFADFLNSYGSTCISFLVDPDAKEFKKICTYDSQLLAIAFGSKLIFLPYHFADKHAGTALSFYQSLIEAILLYRSRVYYEAPQWVDDYKFRPEAGLIAQKEEFTKKLDEIDHNLEIYSLFKQTLWLGDDELKERVIEAFEKGFDIRTESKEEFKEDLWLLNEGGERILMVEVKGLSANLDRASVSQANNNRDRQGYDENLPALVIANTFMRNPQTIADKRQHIHEDIVKYAEKLNVRLMRTIDLLDFLNQIFEKRITKEDFVKRVVSERGWIKA